eukprot:3300483-Rhodomonas_salina.1
MPRNGLLRPPAGPTSKLSATRLSSGQRGSGWSRRQEGDWQHGSRNSWTARRDWTGPSSVISPTRQTSLAL